VPSGESEEMTCRSARPRCRGAQRSGAGTADPGLARRWRSIVVTAAVLALLAARIGFQPVLGAAAFLAILGVALAQVDVAVQRLPDPADAAGLSGDDRPAGAGRGSR